MGDTPIPVAVGSLALSGGELNAGTGFFATIADNDVTWEFTRKILMLDRLTQLDTTTQLVFAINKAWRLAHNHADITIAFRDSA